MASLFTQPLTLPLILSCNLPSFDSSERFSFSFLNLKPLFKLGKRGLETQNPHIFHFLLSCCWHILSDGPHFLTSSAKLTDSLFAITGSYQVAVYRSDVTGGLSWLSDSSSLPVFKTDNLNGVQIYVHKCSALINSSVQCH